MKFRKTALIEAEKFDASNEMIKKYHVGVLPSMLIDKFNEPDDDKNWSKVQYRIATLEGMMKLHVNDWIATGVNGEHWAIADDVFKKTYEPVENDYSATPSIPK